MHENLIVKKSIIMKKHATDAYCIPVKIAVRYYVLNMKRMKHNIL